MKKKESDATRSAGTPCPPLQKVKGLDVKIVIDGRKLRVPPVAPGLRSFIRRLMRGSKAASGQTALKVLAVLMLGTVMGAGLGDGNLFDTLGPNCAPPPNRPAHGAGVRQAGNPPRGKMPSAGNGVGSGADDGVASGGNAENPRQTGPKAETLKFGKDHGNEILEAILHQTDLLNRLVRGQQQLLAATAAEPRPGTEPRPGNQAIEPAAVAAVRAAPAIGAKAGKKAKTPDVPVRGSVGRLSWDNDFNDIVFGGVHYDLTTRDAARHCIRYFVMMEAFNKATARHLENEINKYVREQVKRDVLKPGSDGNLRIQHYFSGSGKNLLGLCKEFVRAAGRNGCFYLQVF